MSAWLGFRGRGLQRVAIALLVVAVLLALKTAWTRQRVESDAVRVGVIVDGDELDRLIRRSDIDREDALGRLAELGVTGVGLHELTLQDGADTGQIFLVDQATLMALESPLAGWAPDDVPPTDTLVGWTGDDLDPWLEAALQSHLPSVARRLQGTETASLWQLTVDTPPSEIGLGFYPGDIDLIRRAGLLVVPRLRGDPHLTQEQLQLHLDQLRDMPLGPVVFWGPGVAGFPTYLPLLTETLAQMNAPIGVVEFAPQSGLRELIKALGYVAVRVHSITAREMAAGLPVRLALDRWMRAVRERNIRLLYVRLYPADEEIDGSESAWVNFGYIESLVGRLRAAGYVVSPPNPAGPLAVDLWAVAFSVLAVGGAVGLAGKEVLFGPPSNAADGRENKGRGGAYAILGGCAASLVFWLLWLKGYTVLARQSMALVAAITFPVLAVVAGLRFVEKGAGSGVSGGAGSGAGRGACNGPSSEADSGTSGAGSGASGGRRSAVTSGASQSLAHRFDLTAMLRRGVGAWALATGITLLGALFLVVLLGDIRFMLKIEQFRGIKPAYVLPLITVLVMAARSIAPRAGGLKTWLNVPVRLWHVGLVLLSLSVFAIYVLRTGNQGLPVLSLEEAFRRLLEDAFVARPRTKEFLVGHPALFIGLSLVGRGRAFPVWAFILLGTIGQISIINTFAHAHAPLLLSLLRTGYGLLLGLFLGAAALCLAAWVRRRGLRLSREAASGSRPGPGGTEVDPFFLTDGASAATGERGGSLGTDKSPGGRLR